MNETTREQKYAFTIFTATYNRAHTLMRVYESLARQTFRDFEWVIVDDGSTDYTRSLVSGWQQADAFPLHYVYQEHGGYPVALNRGVAEAAGEIFIGLDSDDACTPDALERIKFHWDAIPPDKKGRFAGVTCLCQDENGAIIGTRFPSAVFDSDGLEMRYRYKMVGEKWTCNRTELLRRFPFPTAPGADYVPQSVVWSQIAVNGYKKRFINEALRIYHQGADQLTHDALRHAWGHAQKQRQILSYETRWFRYAPQSFLRAAAHYSRFAFHAHIPPDKQARDIKSGFGKFLWVVALPLGWWLYRRDKRRRAAIEA